MLTVERALEVDNSNGNDVDGIKDTAKPFDIRITYK